MLSINVLLSLLFLLVTSGLADKLGFVSIKLKEVFVFVSVCICKLDRVHWHGLGQSRWNK